MSIYRSSSTYTLGTMRAQIGQIHRRRVHGSTKRADSPREPPGGLGVGHQPLPVHVPRLLRGRTKQTTNTDRVHTGERVSVYRNE